MSCNGQRQVVELNRRERSARNGHQRRPPSKATALARRRCLAVPHHWHVGRPAPRRRGRAHVARRIGRASRRARPSQLHVAAPGPVSGPRRGRGATHEHQARWRSVSRRASPPLLAWGPPRVPSPSRPLVPRSRTRRKHDAPNRQERRRSANRRASPHPLAQSRRGGPLHRAVSRPRLCERPPYLVGRGGRARYPDRHVSSLRALASLRAPPTRSQNRSQDQDLISTLRAILRAPCERFANFANFANFASARKPDGNPP